MATPEAAIFPKFLSDILPSNLLPFQLSLMFPLKPFANLIKTSNLLPFYFSFLQEPPSFLFLDSNSIISVSLLQITTCVFTTFLWQNVISAGVPQDLVLLIFLNFYSFSKCFHIYTWLQISEFLKVCVVHGPAFIKIIYIGWNGKVVLKYSQAPSKAYQTNSVSGDWEPAFSHIALSLEPLTWFVTLTRMAQHLHLVTY